VCVQQDDAVVLQGALGAANQAEAPRQITVQGLQEGEPQARNVPRRRDHVDLAQALSRPFQGETQGASGEAFGALPTAEPLFLEHDRGNTVLEKRQAAVVGGSDQSEYPHLISPWQQCVEGRLLVRRTTT